MTGSTLKLVVVLITELVQANVVWSDVIAPYYRSLFQYRMNSYNRGRRGLKKGSGEWRRRDHLGARGRVPPLLTSSTPICQPVSCGF